MKKIVLIEDNIDVRETTQEILELSNYKVFACENGKKGIESVLKEKPDIIICDIGMSGIDGYSVLSVLSRNLETCGIPFIFLTADTDLRKGMNLGADDYIIKPFKESELIEAIEARLSRNKKLKSSSQEILEDLSLFFDDISATRELEELTKIEK